MKKLLIAIVLVFTCTLSYGATVTLGNGSYTDTLPAGQASPDYQNYKSSASVPIVPTNDWWTSILSSSYSARMYAHPLIYKCNSQGLLLGVAELQNYSTFITYGNDINAPYKQQLQVCGMYSSFTSTVTCAYTKLDSFSDWAVTPLFEDSTDTTKSFTATIGHGFVFTYFNFSSGTDARILFPLSWSTGQFDIYDSSGVLLAWDTNYTADHVSLRYLDYTTSKEVYYGLYCSTGTVFKLGSAGHILDITFNGTNRYLSVGALTKKADLPVWYNYAYAFVKDTKVSWGFNESQSVVVTSFTVTTESKQYNQTTPLIGLFAHQWKNSSNSYLAETFSTLRGTMKLVAADKFSVSNKFHGILPAFADLGKYNRAHLQSLLDNDINSTFSYQSLYYHGKELAKNANLLPIAYFLGNTNSKNALTAKLKNDLGNWLNYTAGETYGYFYYEPNWKALLGYDMESSFLLNNLNDQHFTLGYYVWASALLALYDNSFKNDYKDMVELLIRSYACPDRTDTMFPFLRSFDAYEGHSWANGFSLSDDGNDQESSSEAMNSWAAIYLWGLATGNETYKKLGIWGYTTEYSAIKEYYFDIDADNYSSIYKHKTIGRLFGGKLDYNTWFGSEPEYIHGIQLLPVTPASVYLGYNTDFAKANYDDLVLTNGAQPHKWNDIFWNYQVMFDTQAAADAYSETVSIDDGNSKTFSYFWVNTFSQLSKVDTSVYADVASYGVFNNNNNLIYMSYNNTVSTVTVNFYKFSDNSLVRSFEVMPKSVGFQAENSVAISNSVLTAQNNVYAYPNPMKNYSDNITFMGLYAASQIKIYNISGELVRELIDNDGDRMYVWDARNFQGSKLASGVYLCVVKDMNDGSRHSICKFCIIK